MVLVQVVWLAVVVVEDEVEFPAPCVVDGQHVLVVSPAAALDGVRSSLMELNEDEVNEVVLPDPVVVLEW